MKRFITTILFITFLSGCLQASNEDGIIVRRVVDGDTIELSNGARVRYLGVNTPETRKRVGRDWVYSPEPYAEAAMKLNSSLVLGKGVKLEFDKDREDKYGRWLAFVYQGDVMVSKELLKAGLAMFVVYPPNVARMDELIAVQDGAMAGKKGIWKDMPEIDPFEAYRYAGRIVRVRGEVMSTGRGGKAAFINFGERGSGALTGVIYSQNLILFEKKGIFPTRDYTGKTIEIYGKIDDDGEPSMIVYHPGQIRITD